MDTQIYEYEKKLIEEIKNMPVEYLPNLLDMVRLFRRSIDLKPAEESFIQGWKEAMNDDVIPVEELWDGIDD